jgi:hypothetical protein
MSRPDAVLLVTALAYPVASFGLFWLAVQPPLGIPSIGDLIVFGFVLPGFGVLAAVWAKLSGWRLTWAAVVMFAGWVAVVGYCHISVIATIWESIY